MYLLLGGDVLVWCYYKDRVVFIGLVTIEVEYTKLSEREGDATASLE